MCVDLNSVELIGILRKIFQKVRVIYLREEKPIV